MPLVRLRERVVVGLADASGKASVRPVHHRLRQRQRMHLHALLVHRSEPRIEIHEFRTYGPGHQMAVLELRALAFDHPVLEAVAGAVLGDQIEEVLRKIMRVNVDRCVVAHRGSGARLYLGGDRRTYNEALEFGGDQGKWKSGSVFYRTA